MRAHHSRSSCFYCLSPETYYKHSGRRRVEIRPGEHTIFDSKNGRNGFGDIPAEVVNYLAIYETPIDMLHNFGEGIGYRIISGTLHIMAPEHFKPGIRNLSSVLSGAFPNEN
uniref:Uncharacterized protein n=1 Tax=Caenorhabditis japonica TaxID=281687 RepID=A0A8R1I356_CAEJA